MKKSVVFLSLLFTLATSTLFAQNDSCHLRISVLTCAPGEELYSTFGHCAIRVTDSSTRQDLTFNYGTFNFDDPDFYTNFLLGKQLFSLSVSDFSYFMPEYVEEHRTVTEQVLNLSCAEKQRIFDALKENYLPQNRYYKYDFFFDNCTTRIEGLLKNNVAGYHIPNPIVPPGTTFRKLIHNYLDKGGEPWSKLGIDILLGSKIDKLTTTEDAQFLPDYLRKGIDSAVTPAQPHGIVLRTTNIYEGQAPGMPQGKYVPLIIFSVFALVVLVLSPMTSRPARMVVRIADTLLLYLTGLAGIMLLFMWFGTDHLICRNNFNLLWALPTNFIAAFFIWKKPSWVRKYFLAAALIQIVTLVGWWAWPQQLNIALVPIVIVLAFRYIQLAKNK
ncbi:Lnb N-terminal periplasmic domain-containing protein [Deminuibacter soli]|uniref:DUF4105 domain-containing protein n=1 Tax=Deminuibacter soli TaxID=2291815 RepID=A0A3E1NNL1_9BACT|nr:DUF4105 domain-containing protein [Deminuibacter soli]RFM29512.1 DUF4105 domain-containing protein [Deminuibacter soli]